MILLSELLEIIKRAAIDAVEAKKPVNLILGSVTQTEPLEIKISQKTFLSGEQLLLPETLSGRGLSATGQLRIDRGDYEDKCEFSGIIAFENTLGEGDAVALLRVQGGQKYFVLGRLAV